MTRNVNKNNNKLKLGTKGVNIIDRNDNPMAGWKSSKRQTRCIK
jgi:hypothetical protein